MYLRFDLLMHAWFEKSLSNKMKNVGGGYEVLWEDALTFVILWIIFHFLYVNIFVILKYTEYFDWRFCRCFL